MKILSPQIDNYIQNIASQKISGCLVFGPETSIANYRFNLIAKKIIPDLSDPFLVSNISKERLSENKSLIMDEFFSLSFFGGRKLILIKEIDTNVTESLKALFLEKDFAKKSDNFILIQAGDLDKSSALRKSCEDNPYFSAIACYEDDERTIKQFIENELAKNQVKSSFDIISYLFEKFGKNRQIIISELEKILLYLGDKKDLTIDIIDKTSESTNEISTNEFITNFSAQNFSTAILQAEKLFKQGVEPILLIRFLSNYLQKLYQAKCEIESKTLNFEEAVKSQRLFFKTEIEFRKNLKTLSLDFLIKNLKKLEELEIKIKSSTINSRLLFTAFLQDLAKEIY